LLQFLFELQSHVSDDESLDVIGVEKHADVLSIVHVSPFHNEMLLQTFWVLPQRHYVFLDVQHESFGNEAAGVGHVVLHFGLQRVCNLVFGHPLVDDLLQHILLHGVLVADDFVAVKEAV